MKDLIIKIVIISILLCAWMALAEDNREEMYLQTKNVTIVGNGWVEGSRTHDYIYPTDAGYVLNMPGSCDDMGCVGKNITIIGHSSVYYNSYYKRNEMSVNWIVVDEKTRGWL